MKILKTMSIILVILVILLVLSPFFQSFWKGFKGQMNLNTSSQSEQTQKPALELLEKHDEIIDYNHYIIGTIKNNTSKKYNYVQVTFILTDDDMNQVGTAMDNINDLEPGATWKFKALIFDDSDVKHYKLGEITGF